MEDEELYFDDYTTEEGASATSDWNLDPDSYDTSNSGIDLEGNPAAINMELLQAFAAQQEQLASQLQQELQLPPQFAQAIAADMMGSGPLGQIQEQVKSADEPQGAIPSAAKDESGDARLLGKQFALDKNFGGFGLQAKSPEGLAFSNAPAKEQNAIEKLVSGEWGKMGGLDWLKILAPALGFGANYIGAQSANKDAQKAAAMQNANVQGALSNFKEQMGRSTKIPGRGYMATTANRNAINIG